VVYIAGYVVKMVMQKVRCPICIAALTCSRSEADRNPSFALLNRKRWGQLIDASSDVILICIETERLFTVMSKQSNFNSFSSISAKIANSVLKHFFMKSN